MYQAIRPRLVDPGSVRNYHQLLLPTGTEYHVGHSRIRPQCLDANPSDRSAQAEVLLREEPDEEDEEEDEGDGKEDNDDDDNDDGYSE
jgi:hypothetical protein